MPQSPRKKDGKYWCDCRRCGGAWKSKSTHGRHRREEEAGQHKEAVFVTVKKSRTKKQPRSEATLNLQAPSGPLGRPTDLQHQPEVENNTPPPGPSRVENNVPPPASGLSTVENNVPPPGHPGIENYVPPRELLDTENTSSLNGVQSPSTHAPRPLRVPSPIPFGQEMEDYPVSSDPVQPATPSAGSPRIPPPTDRELQNMQEMLPFDCDDPNGNAPLSEPEPQSERSQSGDLDTVDLDYTIRQLEKELNEIVIHRKDLQIAVDFIRLIQEATLEHSALSIEAIDWLRCPSPPSPLQSDNYAGLSLSLHMFLATLNASQGVYNELVTRLSMCFPHHDILSLYRVMRQVTMLAGTATMVHDMCPDSCVAFTGPFSELEQCPMPRCGKSRWDSIQLAKGKRVPAKTFSTIALGPQLQALFGNPDAAREMQYRQRKTQEVLNRAKLSNGALVVDEFDDIYSGSEYLRLYQDGTIDDNSILLLLSIDGAQLYKHKASDCWIYVWVILDLDPALRYKKCYVLPGGFIPGPKKPKNLDSFLFPGLHHISALQKERLKVWDASKNSIVSRIPLICLKTADAPGMALISGEVGHSGAKGCRKYCDVPTRLKPGGSHYYPVLLKPIGSVLSDPPDIKLSEWSPYFSQKTYDDNLRKLLATKTNAEYEDQRKESGLCKPSIFTGLPRQAFGVPGGFPVDTMHLISLNITDLLLSLWRGTMKCDSNDDRSTWDWVVLTGKVWKTHGEYVAKLRDHLPSTYERPPRNPAEKLNSGYKATEFNTYVYSYLPALLRGVLPRRYLLNFYKLVKGVRIILQRSITRAQLLEAHGLFISFLEEFEEIYVRRMPSRMHFVRQCMHVLWHLVPEAFRYGPPCNYAQWTIERTIGNLGQEIRLHSNPYANLAKRGILRATINSLLIKYPELDTTSRTPRGSINLSNHYLLLRPSDTKFYCMREVEYCALQSEFLVPPITGQIVNKIIRYGQLKIPNGQIVRSAWREDERKSPHPNCYVKLRKLDSNGNPTYGEVLYFFRMQETSGNSTKTCAMISLSTPVDPAMFRDTYGVLSICSIIRYQVVQVFDISLIDSVVAFLPYDAQQFFVIDELGLVPENFEEFQGDGL